MPGENHFPHGLLAMLLIGVLPAWFRRRRSFDEGSVIELIKEKRYGEALEAHRMQGRKYLREHRRAKEPPRDLARKIEAVEKLIEWERHGGTDVQILPESSDEEQKRRCPAPGEQSTP